MDLYTAFVLEHLEFSTHRIKGVDCFAKCQITALLKPFLFLSTIEVLSEQLSQFRVDSKLIIRDIHQMDGRNHMHFNAYEDTRRFHPEGHFGRGPPLTRRPLLEDELEMRHFEIQKVLHENQGLAEDRMALRRELGSAKDEIRRMSLVVSDARAEQEMFVRELVDKGLRLEADLRATEPLKKEVMQLREEFKRLNAVREELYGQIQGLKHVVGKLRTDNQQTPLLKVEMDGIRKELMHVSDALNYEKRAKVELIEQQQVMEKNLISMAREVEKLRADLSTVDGRHLGHCATYGTKFSSFDGHIPTPHGDGYGAYLGTTEKGSMYGSNAASWIREKSRPARH